MPPWSSAVHPFRSGLPRHIGALTPRRAPDMQAQGARASHVDVRARGCERHRHADPRQQRLCECGRCVVARRGADLCHVCSIRPVEFTSRARKRGGDGGGELRVIADDVRPFHPGLTLGTDTSSGWVEQGSKTRRICRLRRSCSRLWVVGWPRSRSRGRPAGVSSTMRGSCWRATQYS